MLPCVTVAPKSMSMLKKHSQAGFTMVVGLLILLMIALLGITTMKTSGFQEKMSNNLQDKELSFQASESGLKAGENWITAQTTLPVAASTQCTPQPCVTQHNPSFYLEDQTAAWWSANSAQVAANTLTTVHSQPYYYLEYLYFEPDDLTVGYSIPTGKYYYYVTSSGTGAVDDSQSMIQSTYSRRF